MDIINYLDNLNREIINPKNRTICILNLGYFINKENGNNFNLKQGQLIKQIICTGDILYIYFLYRFFHNEEQILQKWNTIIKEIETDIAVLGMPLLDITQYKDSRGNLIANLVL